MLESRDNNHSLMNLKECVRAKAKMANEDGFVHIPWRGNKLTMLLKVCSFFTLVFLRLIPSSQSLTQSLASPREP